MIISVGSGKGGTGKTTIAVNLALSLNNVQFFDCDVEAPNAFIFLKPLINITEKAYVNLPVADLNKCDYCGKCIEVCLYNAIAVITPKKDIKGSVLVFPNLCHDCGACEYFCHKKALINTKREIGEIKAGKIKNIEFYSGHLNVGEAMAPPLIRRVKTYINKTKTVIIDAPPGTTCPLITAVNGSDFCILVTEPTPFGLNDLILAVSVLREMNIPFAVVINLYGIGDKKVDEYCNRENIPILIKIPYMPEIAKAYSKGLPIVEIFPEYHEKFINLYNEVNRLLLVHKEKK